MSGAANDAAWHAKRARVVGGSEIAALFGCSPYISHYALWQVKAGRVPPPEVGNPRTLWGQRLEPVIAEAIADQELLTIRKAEHVTDPTTPGMGCTPDYLIEEHEYADETGPGVLELKNVDWLVHRRSWTDGEPPLHILLQLQMQLACTGRGWGIVGCLIGGNDLVTYRYRGRPKLIADIRRRVREFWRSIEEGREPPVDGSDSASAVLRALYATPTEEVADLTGDNELPEICSGFLAAVERRKEAAKEEAEFRNRLVAKIGPHLVAETQGFRVRVAVTAAKPDRVAEPGEVIKGRAEARRYTIKEIAA